jgi:hypothetical protein
MTSTRALLSLQGHSLRGRSSAIQSRRGRSRAAKVSSVIFDPTHIRAPYFPALVESSWSARPDGLGGGRVQAQLRRKLWFEIKFRYPASIAVQRKRNEIWNR